LFRKCQLSFWDFRMRRREFITILGGAAVEWPLGVSAQQSAVPVVGYLDLGAPESSASFVAAFRKGLSETGFVEGRNVSIEYLWGYNDSGRAPELAADLVHRRVAVIAAIGATGALAAKRFTETIPIIFGTAADPVEVGLVASLNRPGGNVTGFTSMNTDLGGKRLGMLRELMPRATRFAFLADPTGIAAADIYVKEMEAATSAISGQFDVLTASTNREIETAFASMMQRRTDALLVPGQILFFNRVVQLVSLAAHHRVPAIYVRRDFPDIGGLMSYGTSTADFYRQVGLYTGRILKGEKAANLPVLRAAKFELVINLQTARLLGIDVPPTLLAIADEVIE
jgi:putative ABC transport system substrate-binding protein